MARRAVAVGLGIAAALLLVVVVAGAWAWRGYQDFLAEPLAIPDSGAVIVVEPGSGAYTVVRLLAERGLTRADWKWRALLRLEPVLLQAGEYRLEEGMTPRDVVGHELDQDLQAVGPRGGDDTQGFSEAAALHELDDDAADGRCDRRELLARGAALVGQHGHER